MGRINHCHKCSTRLTRDNQVKRNVAVCPQCQALTHLPTGKAYTGKITLRVTRDWMHYHRLTTAAQTFGQVAFMPEATR